MELTPERIEILAKRAAAAKELVDQGRVHQLVGTVAPDQYVAIHSKGAWLIGRGSGSYPWECSCPDWEYRGEETLGHCKHVLAVLLYRDANPPEVSVITPGAPALSPIRRPKSASCTNSPGKGRKGA